MQNEPIMITLRQIRDNHPCEDGWRKILKARGGRKKGHLDAPFPLADALESNGLGDTLWALRCLPEHDALWRLYAVWCARQVQHLMTDKRSLDALDVAERFARGEATREELSAARDAAWAAARGADWNAAGAAAAAAAETSIRAATAGASAKSAARATQTEELRRVLTIGPHAYDKENAQCAR